MKQKSKTEEKARHEVRRRYVGKLNPDELAERLILAHGEAGRRAP